MGQMYAVCSRMQFPHILHPNRASLIVLSTGVNPRTNRPSSSVRLGLKEAWYRRGENRDIKRRTFETP